ncbi:MAG: sensor histidine kinase [bacterium]
MNETKPSFGLQKITVPNFKDIDISKLLSEILSVVREAILDISAGNLCVATLQVNSLKVQVSTRQPISSVDLQSLKQQIAKHVSQIQKEVFQGSHLTTVINGIPENSYHVGDTKSQCNQNLIVPLDVQDRLVGILYVGSLGPAIDLRQAKLIRRLSREVSRALRHLWYLNSRQKEQFELLVSRIIDGVILCDLSKKVLFVNNSAKRILGIDTKELCIGRSLKDLPAAYLIDYLEHALKLRMFEFNKVVNTEEERSKFVGVHIERLKNSRNKEIGWMIVLRDVTTNWQSHQMRTSLAAASHDIKTPVNSIQAAIDLLLDKDLGDLNEKQEHCLKVIKEDIKRLQRMLKDLLDLSRFDEGIQFLDRRKQITLGLLVDKVIESFEFFAKSKNIKIENIIPKSIPTFKGDRDKLQQVVANLIENAIKYSLPGGKVIVEAELIKNTLKVWVKDQGVGIEPSEHHRIFERFRQLDNYPEQLQRGYGLGLSIAKEIVEANGGEIGVESAPGVGSNFYFTVPV